MANTKRMTLSEEEVRLILHHREECRLREELTKKRASCQHKWGDGGHGHAYECVICGELKWE